MRRGLGLGAAVIAVVLLSAGGTRAQSSDYLDFAGLTGELRALADTSANASMRSIGTSRAGREIWLVEVGNPAGIPMGERPAMLIVGNLEGDHVVGSHLALETIRFLLNDPAAASVLSEQAVYVVPRLNPDGAEAMFAAVKSDRRGNALSYDADNDGPHRRRPRRRSQR